MKSEKYHLAQINVAQLKAPIDDPIIKEFREALDFINQVGADSPGFVWAFKEGVNPADEFVFPDTMLAVNYTLWESYEDLHHFVYNTVHSYFLKNRKRWFSKLESPHVAMWWVPAGYVPSLAEAKAKLDQLEAEGPGPEVFNLRQRYDETGKMV